MIPSFNPAGAGSTAATVTVTRCDTINGLEKTDIDHRTGGTRRISRIFDGIVSFTKVWGVLTAIGKSLLVFF